MILLKKHIINSFSILVLLTIGLVPLNGQIIDMIFDTKDFSGEEMPLNERLDPEVNHLILFSAFWCAPCVQQINNKHSKNIKNYRDNYNLKVIILDDENYNSPNEAISKIRNNRWYFEMYLTDNLYGSLGVNAIPRYFFLPAGETEAFRVSTSSFLDQIDEYYIENGYESIFLNQNDQILINDDCENFETHSFGDDEEPTVIGDYTYYTIGGIDFRTGILNKNILRYDPFTESDVVVFDYYLDLCDDFTLKDHQGDEIELKVESIVYENGEILIETDAVISNDCGEDVPFVMSSVFGSNAGVLFNIENGEIISRLLCHSQNEEVIFSIGQFTDLCEPITSTENSNLTPKFSITNNPGNGQFRIDGLAVDMSIDIYNSIGHKVKSTNYKKDQLVDISQFQKGVYLINLKIEGKIINTIKYVLIP